MTMTPEPRDLMRQLTAGQISRRAFIARAAVLGFSASAIAGFLAACGGAAPTATTGAAATTAATAAATTAATRAATAAGGTTPAAMATPTRAAGAASPATTGSPAAGASPVRPAGSPAASPGAAGGAPSGGGVGSASKGPFAPAAGLGPAPTKRGGGGNLKILYHQAPTIMNPHLAQGTKDFDLSRLVYEPLADFDATDGMVPMLAAEIPSRENGGVAADGKSVTWKLKSGVKWSDGQPFKASDVVFTWKYVADEATASGSAISYANVANVEAVNDTTVKVTFKEAIPAWYQPFVSSLGMIIPEHIFKDGIGAAAKNFAANLKPVGTGPYRTLDFKPGDSASLELNPNWRDANGPFFDKVEWKGGGDEASAARAVLSTGDYNVAWNLQIPPAVLAQLTASGAKGKIGTQPGFGVERILINFTDPNKDVDGERSSVKAPHPFLADIKVRKAFNLLADRKTVAETTYGPAGDPTAAIHNAPESLIPPGQASAWEFSIEKASQQLDAAGWTKSGQYRAKGGVPMKVLFQTTVSAVRQAEQQIVKDALEKAGIQTELKSIPSGVFFSPDEGNPDTAAHFYADLEMFTNGAESPDLQSYLAGWTTKEIVSKANKWGLNNYNRYSNPEYDKVIADAAKELDPTKRNALFIKAQQILYDDVVNIPLVARKGPFAYTTGLEGFAPSAWAGLTWNIANWVKK